MEFIETERGGRKLLRDGYLYVFKKNLANDITSWECVLRRQGQCRASIKLDAQENFVEEVNDHTHPPSRTECDLVKTKASLKRRATETLDSSRQILSNQLTNISDGVAIQLPSLGNISRTIRRQRQERNAHPNPPSREAIPILPLEFQQTDNGEEFLFYDSGVGQENRMLLFASPIAKEYLRSSSHWFGDGTFKVCPSIFFQLYTIHALCDGTTLPCIYCLLPNKTEETYNVMWREVMNFVQHQPDDILTDFELASINGAAQIIPDIVLKGCFFHLTRNFWKKIQEFGLKERYINEEEFSTTLRMVLAISFVPPDDVIVFFEELSDVIRDRFGIACDEILEYFEDNYIGRFRRNAQRAHPRFGIDLWNMFHRTADELPRTNNCLEGWHRGFQATVASCHPLFWKFVGLLKKEEGLNRVKMLQALGGHQPPQQRRRYADSNQRLIRLVDSFPNYEHMRYLRAVAHNLGGMG